MEFSGREVIFEFHIFGYWGSMLLDAGGDAYDTDGEGQKASFIRDVSPCQNGWIFEKVPNGGRVPIQGLANIRIFEYIRIFSDTNIRSYHIRIIFKCASIS